MPGKARSFAGGGQTRVFGNRYAVFTARKLENIGRRRVVGNDSLIRGNCRCLFLYYTSFFAFPALPAFRVSSLRPYGL
jgi:hypothetical protein